MQPRPSSPTGTRQPHPAERSARAVPAGAASGARADASAASPARARIESARRRPDLSLVAPVFNEAENLVPLYRSVVDALGARANFELVLVDDGSTDASPAVIAELVEADPRVTGVFFAANCGQTAAITVGLRAAGAPILATLDADLQNDPHDLPEMVKRLLAEDLGAVVGFRIKRRDSWVRRLSSRLANRVRNVISGDDIRDTGCSLKVFRADAVRALPMFEGMHRFLPTLLRYHGFRVAEHGVSHHPRVAGESKYGIRNRAWRAFKDLLAVRWMRSRLIAPEIRAVRRGSDAQRP